jgi:mannose-6-phosphate isomerase
MNISDIIELKCDVQHYPWGGCARDGSAPYIANLVGAPAETGQPFAELWIGAHPKLPAAALVGDASVPLDQLIHEHTETILGGGLVEAGVKSLPFLLKVLDCDQPLSIQAHPDLRRAAELNARDPEHYGDANHKPEIAIGITGMTAFCQFRPTSEIQGHIARLPALAAFLGDAGAGLAPGSREWLQALYARVFSASQDAVGTALGGVRRHLSENGPQGPADEWFLKLEEFYPGDRGMLSAFFLNIVHLGPGEGVFLGPNEPHAYLAGTIIECMASSDNVVRAGLTPKFIDRDVLVDMLTYRQGLPQMDTGEELSPGETVYRVPVPEFQVEVYTHQDGYAGQYGSGGAVSILLILEGQAMLRTPQRKIDAPRGSTWLWPADLAECGIDYLAPGTTVVRARPNMSCI